MSEIYFSKIEPKVCVTSFDGRAVQMLKEDFDKLQAALASAEKDRDELKQKLADKDMELYKLKDIDDEICADNALLNLRCERLVSSLESIDMYVNGVFAMPPFEALQQITATVGDIAQRAIVKSKSEEVSDEKV